MSRTEFATVIAFLAAGCGKMLSSDAVEVYFEAAAVITTVLLALFVNVAGWLVCLVCILAIVCIAMICACMSR